jgi:hypothetical protein
VGLAVAPPSTAGEAEAPLDAAMGTFIAVAPGVDGKDFGLVQLGQAFARRCAHMGTAYIHWETTRVIAKSTRAYA